MLITSENSVNTITKFNENSSEQQFLNDIFPLDRAVKQSHETLCYTASDGTPLTIDYFEPEQATGVAVIFFFGGGWNRGSTEQFHPQSKYLSRRGIAAFCVEYRVHSRHGTTMPDAVEDACRAVKWIHENADRFGIDSEKIIISGGSCGGQLAAAAATYSEKKLAAMILFNPVVDITKVNSKTIGPPELRLKYSPIHIITQELPPTLILHGSDDQTVPFSQAKQYYRQMRKSGNQCKLVRYDGVDHAFFNFGTHDNRYFHFTMRVSLRFLNRLALY